MERVDGLVARFVGWLVVRLLDYSIVSLVGVLLLFGCLVGWLNDLLFDWMVGCLVGCLIGCWTGRLVDLVGPLNG